MASGFPAEGDSFAFMRETVSKLSPNVRCYRISPINTGAGGGTRTHTTFYGPRILSPVRLPFRHTGCAWQTLIVNSSQVKLELLSDCLKFFDTLENKQQPSDVFDLSGFQNHLKTKA